MKINTRLSWLVALALTCGAAHAANWTATWGAAPTPPSPAMGPMPGTPSFSNQTLRQIVRISAGGNAVRIRLTNEYSTRPLAIGALRVALANPDGTVIAGSDRPVTFAGKPTTTIPAGAPLLSDPVEFAVKPLATLAVSLYLPGDTGPCTCHGAGMQDTLVSAPGDHTAEAFVPQQKLQARAFLSGIEVQSPVAARSIVLLGDSITDGVGSTVGANRRWPDLLAERLVARDARTAPGVVNLGISGNRVLDPGMGESALTRFDRDVLAVPGVAWVVVFMGVNDLGLGFGMAEGPMADAMRALRPATPVTADALIAAYRQLIARAQARGIKVYGATIAPYEGAGYFSVQGEAVRQAVNTWIRSSKEFDAVLDFDAVLRDPAKPAAMRDNFQAGDHLHGSDAGYAAMAQSIDLTLFR
ncbi:MAG: SGNH/GDSL hydrolase family protein [Pseudomonadota bacterium]